MRTPPAISRAFSLIELVVVVVIIGIIAAIAVPRLSGATQNSQSAVIRGSLKVLTNAVEVYAAEHNGLTPAQAPDGSADPDADAFIKRLTTQTAADGVSGGAAIYGPYLRAMPTNPISGLSSLRIDGPPAGAGTDGWRYDSALRIFQADSLAEASITVEAAADAAVLAADADAAIDAGK